MLGTRSLRNKCSRLQSSTITAFSLKMSLKRKATDVAVDAAKKAKQDSSITSFFGQPKAKASTAATNGSEPASSQTEPASSQVQPETTAPATFDKEAWAAKLTPEQKELLKLEIDTLHESWFAALKDELLSKDFLELKRFLKKEAETGKTIFPPSKDVYSWYDVLTLIIKNPDRLTLSQVSSHPSPQRQSSHTRPRSLSQCQPSTRPLLLSSSTHTSSTKSEEHVHSLEKRLPRLQSSAQEWRSAHSLGRPWSLDAEHLPHCPCARSQLPLKQRLGEAHSKGHRYSCGEA